MVESSVKIKATCQNGEAELFPTMREAQWWAQWGHCCLYEHTFEEVKDA